MLGEKFWKIVAGLGVPGLALGVLYALLRVFNWDLAPIPASWLTVLVVLFLVVVGTITLLALHYWRPARPGVATYSVKVGAKAKVEGAVAGRDLLAQAGVPEQSMSEPPTISGVVIGKAAVVGGPVAGRDLHIHPDEVRGRVDELIEILESRAEMIRAGLSSHFQYVKVQKFLHAFDELHRKHIASLRAGHVIHAHEILVQIHTLSSALESDEFWARHRRETPHLRYYLADDAFEWGTLIEMYVGRAAVKPLVAQRRQSRWQQAQEVDSGKEPVYHLIHGA
ncbi:MAG: hypothetical protein ABW277_03460 [Longimicrobiaceae bacterium]